MYCKKKIEIVNKITRNHCFINPTSNIVKVNAKNLQKYYIIRENSDTTKQTHFFPSMIRFIIPK